MPAPSPSATAQSKWTSACGATGSCLRNSPVSRPPIRLFGGKGGVGKTTCAAASALLLAESGRRILAISTDPAHSLGDALRSRLGGEPSRIPTRRGTLRAVELAAAAAVERWRRRHAPALGEIAARGTYLDEQDVEGFLALSLPGADELIAWLEIGRLVRDAVAGGCDEVVVDAAPTAHTLRLLAMPAALRRFAGALERLQERHRWMAERFGGGWRPDESDALIGDLETEAREIEESLRDPERAALVWVMLPEPLSLAETRDALATLDEAGLPVREVIVNRVLPPGDGPCQLCRQRRRDEAEMIREICERLGERTIRLVPQADREPRGRVALRRVGRWLEVPPLPSGRGGQGVRSRRCDPSLLLRPDEDDWPVSRQRARQNGVPSEASPPDPLTLTGEGAAWLDDLAPPGLRLLFFGGKGGVGKTTCAAAVALGLAARRPGARILLLSTDPAHSVGDVLEVPLGDDERAIPGAPPGLRARELDAPRAFAAWRDRRGRAVGEAVAAFTTESAGLEDLLDLTPPGLDELVALSTLVDAVAAEQAAYDLVVVDTAPTGHALRLLEMPELALSWDHYLLSLLLKYRRVVGLSELAAELVGLSRSLKRLEALLRDGGHTRFVAVTRPGELPGRETARLLRALGDLGIQRRAVILNAMPAGGCPRCGDPAAVEEAWRRRLARPRQGRCAIIKAPAASPPPCGVRRLAEWLRSWEALRNE